MRIKTTGWPVHTDDEIIAVNEILTSGCTNYWTGSQGREFEKEFAAFIGTDYAVALMNGTIALEAALTALNIGPGDEVITSCRTFIASASCIVRCGAKPILADVDSESQNITADTIAPCITNKTKTIIVVHLAGWPADMAAICQLADKHQLKVIEDCAQAHGAAINNQRVGSFGHVSAFSFCQDKIMTTAGEGGMITTNDKSIWQSIWSLKDHGKCFDKVYHQQHPPGFRWLHDSFGTNWRMTEIQAAIGRIQLKKLSTWLVTRKRHADILNARFKNHPALRITVPPANIRHAYYKYYVFIKPTALKPNWHRDKILNELLALGVPCFSGICSEIYLEQAFIKNQLAPKAPKPIAKQLGETSLVFLVHPTLMEEEIEKTADTLLKVLKVASH